MKLSDFHVGSNGFRCKQCNKIVVTFGPGSGIGLDTANDLLLAHATYYHSTTNLCGDRFLGELSLPGDPFCGLPKGHSGEHRNWKFVEKPLDVYRLEE